MFIDVIIRNKGRFSDMLFTYRVPEYLEKNISIGYRVSVPFGNSNKPIEAIVFSIKYLIEDKSMIDKIKYAIDIMDDRPFLSEDNIELISWMRNRYMCTYIDVLNLFYPKGYKLVSQKVVNTVKQLEELTIEEEFELDNKERDLLNSLYLGRISNKYNDIAKIFPRSVIERLKAKNLIKITWIYEENKNEKFIKNVYLVENNENEDILNTVQSDKNQIEYNTGDKKKRSTRKNKLGARQQEVIDFLKINNIVEQSTLCEMLNISTSTLKSLESKGLVKIVKEKYIRKPDSTLKINDKKIELNEQQKKVYKTVIDGINKGNNKPYLVHGVTGSGKTEVYLELIEYSLKNGMDSIFLVPEIALTPQTIARVKNKFGDIVGVYHSQLSEGEKHDVYDEIKAGNVRVVIGTRSALFLPFDTLGMLIIDEEHDPSYQSDKSPKYDAIEVARYMSYKHSIPVVLGSATPSISDYYNAVNGDFNLLEITERANNKGMPEIKLVDMRKELHTGNRSFFSRLLLREMKETLSRGEQVILFLNKRGYANFMECKDCGHVFKCKNCDITLTNHKSAKRGVCHYCGYEEDIPKKCPVCKNENISSIGIGTEKVEEQINELFPNSKTLRIDRDTTNGKGKLEQILAKFNRKEADILIGTQMLSKGHDFEDVTLVGVISADMMLNYPDYKSFEQTFQLITQVAGRAGRAEKPGRVVLQTYNTEHFAIVCASNYDYSGFYNKEIELRRKFGYEPFNNIVRIVFSGINQNTVKINAHRFKDTLTYILDEQEIGYDKSILGPNECSISMIREKYRWQVLIKNNQMDIKMLKSMIKYICITKFEEIFDKEVDINIEINPNTFI